MTHTGIFLQFSCAISHFVFPLFFTDVSFLKKVDMVRNSAENVGSGKYIHKQLNRMCSLVFDKDDH